MRSARLACLFCFLLVSFPVWPQQSTATNDQGPALLQRALNALAGTTSIAEMSLTGEARRIAGSDNETGTVVLKAQATGQSRMDFIFPSGQRNEIRSISSDGIPVGSWTGPDARSHAMSLHNLMTSPTWFEPAIALRAFASSQNYTVSYVGKETRDGLSVDHLRVFQQFPDFPNHSASLLQHLSQTEIFLDASTFLPVALVFSQHPDNDAGLDIPVEVRFSDYRAVNGVQVPFHIQRYLNNTLILDIQLQTATLNSGLTASAFSAQ